jgi:hypothetical protein
MQLAPYHIPHSLSKNRSLESLQCFRPCGSSPRVYPMRSTVNFETCVCAAICRTPPYVPSFGFVSGVLRTKSATPSSMIWRGEPGPNSSCSPGTSRSRNVRRHLPIALLFSPLWRAICIFVFQEALSKTILARRTSHAGSDRELARFSICSRLCGLITNTAFGRPIAISIPYSAFERAIFPTILSPLTYGTGLRQAGEEADSVQVLMAQALLCSVS